MIGLLSELKMLKCHRLTSVIEVFDYWEDFKRGFAVVKKAKIEYERMLKILCHLVSDERKGFVAVVLNDGKVDGFGIMENVTPLFSPTSIFLCRGFYHKSGNLPSTIFLMDFFEQWAREHNIKSYSVTTERESGAAIRCFKSEKYGFRRSHVEFVKELN